MKNQPTFAPPITRRGSWEGNRWLDETSLPHASHMVNNVERILGNILSISSLASMMALGPSVPLVCLTGVEFPPNACSKLLKIWYELTVDWWASDPCDKFVERGWRLRTGEAGVLSRRQKWQMAVSSSKVMRTWSAGILEGLALETKINLNQTRLIRQFAKSYFPDEPTYMHNHITCRTWSIIFIEFHPTE